MSLATRPSEPTTSIRKSPSGDRDQTNDASPAVESVTPVTAIVVAAISPMIEARRIATILQGSDAKESIFPKSVTWVSQRR